MHELSRPMHFLVYSSHTGHQDTGMARPQHLVLNYVFSFLLALALGIGTGKWTWRRRRAGKI